MTRATLKKTIILTALAMSPLAAFQAAEVAKPVPATDVAAGTPATVQDSKIVLPPTAKVCIDTARVIHTMAGGAGASWQAMGPTAFWYDGLIHRDNRHARGSGYGGNPPASHTAAWNDLSAEARWLGLDFIRVEMDMKMYEPEREKFDWDSSDMQVLYRILDHCQKNEVDVFLTQMWADVEWNALPGINRLQSAPKSVEDFSKGIGSLLEYLVKTRHYTCIRWLCINNEPGRGGSWWLGADGKSVSLMPALHAVRAGLDKRGIPVPLSGPDWTNPTWAQVENTPEFDFGDKVLGALDAHNYEASPSTDRMKAWADKAHARGIPFLLTEFSSNPPKAYSAQLLNAEKMIAGMNVGVDAFNRWSFVNRGDLDGEWNLVRTFDPKTWNYFDRATPEPVPYFAYGIMTRFLAKHSSVLKIENNNPRLSAAAVRSPKGNLSVYVLNKSATAESVTVQVANLDHAPSFQKYQVTEGSCAKEDFQMNPLGTFEVSGSRTDFTDNLPPQSITVYSTYKLMHKDPGITGD